MADKQQFDLDRMSAEDLTVLIQVAEAKRAEKADAARADLLEEMTQKAAALGLSLQGLMQGTTRAKPGRKARSDAGKPAAIKYRSPKGETWTGRDRPPGWITEAEKAGRKREEFRV